MDTTDCIVLFRLQQHKFKTQLLVSIEIISKSEQNPHTIRSVADIESHIRENVLETRAVNDFNTLSLKDVKLSEDIEAINNSQNTFHQQFQSTVAEKHKSMIESGTYGEAQTYTQEITYIIGVESSAQKK